MGGMGRSSSPAQPWKPQQVGDVPFACRLCHLPPEQLLRFGTALVTPRLPREHALPRCKSPLCVCVALPRDAGLGCPPTTTQLSWSWMGFYWRQGGSCLPGFMSRGYENCLCCPSSDSVLLPRSSVGLGLSRRSHHATVPQAFLRLVWL